MLALLETSLVLSINEGNGFDHFDVLKDRNKWVAFFGNNLYDLISVGLVIGSFSKSDFFDTKGDFEFVKKYIPMFIFEMNEC